MWHVVDDERREDVIGVRNLRNRGKHPIENPQSRAHQQEECELGKNDDTAGEKRGLRFALVASGKQTLNHKLVCAVRGRGEKHAANEPGPEGISLEEAEAKIKDLH